MTIYGIGRAIVDYFVEGRIDKRFMERAFGQLSKDSLPSPTGRPIHVEGAAFSFVLSQISTLDGYNLIKETGGTCVNILKTMATVNPQLSCHFSGTVGGAKDSIPPQADEDGTFFCHQMESLGIHHLLRVVPGNTGHCLVLAGEKQGWLALASPSVAPDFTPDQVQAFLQTVAVAHSQSSPDALVLVEGMELEKQWFCHQLCSAQLPLVLACGTPFGAKMTARFLQDELLQDELLQEHAMQENPCPVKLVLANDLEARILEAATIDFVEWSSKYHILFVITHGCGGSSCYFHGERIFVPAIEVAPEQIVDATGAGDVFAGAFLSQLAEQLISDQLTTEKIMAAMESASKTASKIIQVPLCQLAQLHQTGALVKD